MKTGIELITEERERQLTKWPSKHDDLHFQGEILQGALSYIEISAYNKESPPESVEMEHWWPWDLETFKPGNPVDGIRCLVKAGAMIAAEIDRIQRRTV